MSSLLHLNLKKIAEPNLEANFCDSMTLLLAASTPHAGVCADLCRDTVMDWFTARREMDGLPDNPRAAKQLAATARRALDAPQPLLPSEFLPLRSQPKQQQQQQQAAVSVGAAADASPQQQQQQARARVQSITTREMAALRSALPSPRKQKGEKLKQELGIKAGKTRG
jgi:hypothetical protein